MEDYICPYFELAPSAQKVNYNCWCWEKHHNLCRVSLHPHEHNNNASC